jgi:PadR family transcriptional regulator PadR
VKEKFLPIKYYAITKAGLKGLEEETARWRQMSGVVEKLLAEEQSSCRG